MQQLLSGAGRPDKVVGFLQASLLEESKQKIMNQVELLIGQMKKKQKIRYYGLG